MTTTIQLTVNPCLILSLLFLSTNSLTSPTMTPPNANNSDPSTTNTLTVLHYHHSPLNSNTKRAQSRIHRNNECVAGNFNNSLCEPDRDIRGYLMSCTLDGHDLNYERTCAPNEVCIQMSEDLVFGRSRPSDVAWCVSTEVFVKLEDVERLPDGSFSIPTVMEALLPRPWTTTVAVDTLLAHADGSALKASKMQLVPFRNDPVARYVARQCTDCSRLAVQPFPDGAVGIEVQIALATAWVGMALYICSFASALAG